VTAGQAERRSLRDLYWGAFAARAGFGLLAWALSQLFGLALMEDASAYSERAADLARHWLQGEMPAWFAAYVESGRQAWIMIVLLACFYCLTAGHEMIPVVILLQSLLTAATPGLAYRAGRQLGLLHEGALFAGRLIAYSPAFVFWAGALYKEGVILLILFPLVQHTLRLQQRLSTSSVVVVVVGVTVMFGLRFYLAAILSMTIVAALAFGRRRSRGLDPGAAAARQAVIIVIVVTIFALLGVTDRVGNLVSVEENLRQINTSRQDLASYNSGYLRGTDLTTPEAAARFLPLGLAYFLLVPLPWHIGSMRQNMAILETLAWVVVIYPLAYRGAVRGIKINPQGVTFLVITIVPICCLYALFIGNIGTAYRVRVQVWGLLALLAGWWWESRAGRRRPARTTPVLPPGLRSGGGVKAGVHPPGRAGLPAGRAT
jgi:hypothetical protein